MTRQAALFDLDGVLLDSGPAVRTALVAVATCATATAPHRQTSHRAPCAAPGPRSWLFSVSPIRTTPAPAGGTARSPPRCPVRSLGVLTGLLALRSVNVALGVVTLHDRDRLSWFLPPALTDLLDVVITRQDAPAKPAPDGLHAALARVDVQPEQAVFVGDSPGDMSAARAAGVLALGATRGWHPPSALHTAGAHHLLPDPPPASDRPSCIT
ncbi:HAD-IA family hydrolase [Streptomyces sp. NPDC048430]|uniref:HAD family hydrolase n=1 Tax=Streptomyces sp. NPDC048430 TaxID=3155388 RepID=UPI0034258564